MKGEKNLTKLIKYMRPVLDKREFVFSTVSFSERKKLNVNPICEFQEKEGLTLILEKREAEGNKLKYSFDSKMINLSIHSDLNAVGLLAAITNKLAENNISVNVVSAFYHDHLFVSFDKADEAIRLLEVTAREYAKTDSRLHR